MIRSVLSLLIGYFAVAFLVAVTALAIVMAQGAQPPSITVKIALAVASGLYAIVGGYVAAWIARGAEMKHALALGVVMLALSASMFVPGNPEPLWFKLAMVAVTVPMPLLGGLLRKKMRAA